MNLIRETRSICPECSRIIDAKIFERKGKVFISKNCKKHKKFEDLYFGDYEMYKRFEKWSHDGKGIKNPFIKKSKPICPKDCGLCRIHRSHTALGNIVVTNRCDLRCFYCFFYAKAMGYVYEPSLEQIRMMLRSMREEKPVPANAVQLTGGEPLLRDDILDIIRIAKQEGYDHVQLNTNGIRLRDLKLARKIRRAGVNTIYLSFDGVTKRTNPKNFWEIPSILENCRKAGIGIVLVPTVINTVNDNEVGDILKFAIKNIDIVRGVNYQPVSLVGRITKADVKKYRITIPDVISRMNNIVTKDDFYPVPTVTALTHFIEALTNEEKYELTTHFACGSATYLFLDGEKVIPITRFVDIEGLMKYLNEKSEELRSLRRGKKIIKTIKILSEIGRFIDKTKQPKDLNLRKLLFNIFVRKNYNALGKFHKKSLFVGMMHFMDKFNFDIERVERCCIHYAVPDGRILPFCTFNVIPEWYRDAIQKKYSMSFKEWKDKTGRNVEDDFYKRPKELLETNLENLLLI